MVSLEQLRQPLYQPRTTAQIKADFLASGLTAAEYLFGDSPKLRAQRRAERGQKDLDLANADMSVLRQQDLAASKTKPAS